MKRIFIVSGFLLAGVLAVVLFRDNLFGSGIANTVSAEERLQEIKRKKKGPGTDPGWYQEWFDKRKNENGEIPMGMYRKWLMHDELRKDRVAPILNSITELGPFNVGGRTRALLIDQASTARFLAGGVSGGLWKSTNSGANWTPVNDLAANLGITCITQSPLSSSIVYYGTGEGAANSAGMPGEGIFKSTDGGNTFTQLSSTVNSNFTTVWSIEHSHTNANTVFAGTGSSGLWRTTDGGTTWSQAYSTFSSINDLEAFPDGSLLMTINGTGIFRSTDNGATFTQITSGLPASGFQRIEMAYCQNSPSTVYAQFSGGSNVLLDIYKSTNGGVTWSLVNKPTSTYNFTWYCFMLGVHPTDPNKLVSGAQNAYYSLDGGITWTGLSGGHADYHSYAAHPSNPNEFLIGNDGGVWRLNWTNLAAGATSLNAGYHVTQFYAGFYFPSGNSVMGGTQDNGTHRSLSGTFTNVLGADGGFTAISLQNNNLGYGEYQYGDLFRSTNLQAASPSWTWIAGGIDPTSVDGDHWIAPYEINRTDGNQLYFATPPRIWRTTNTGTNWTAITNNHSTIYAIGVTKAANPIVYFGGSSANFYRINNASTAAAGSEADLSASVPAAVTSHVISCITPHPTNTGTLYVSFSTISANPRVYRVTNATTATPTWTAISGGLPASLPVNWVEVDPLNTNNLFAGTDFGLYYTMDGGTNWYKETNIPNTAIHMLRVRESDRKLFIYTHGRGIWSANMTNAGPYASLPYSNGFESGFFDSYWKVVTSNTNGRVQHTTANVPHSGSWHVTMDVTSSGVYNYARNEMWLRLNLSGETTVNLSFWWKDFSDETNTEDGVYISNNGGNTFVKVFNFNPGSNTDNTWNIANLDIAALAAANGLTLNGTFVIKFQQYDNYAIGLGDGIAIDDINVSNAVGGRFALNEFIPQAPAEVKLYPNPTTDYVTISIPENEEEAGSVEYMVSIMDMSGRIVHRNSEGLAVGKSLQVPVKELPAGTYTVMLSAGEKKIMKKIVKK